MISLFQFPIHFLSPSYQNHFILLFRPHSQSWLSVLQKKVLSTNFQIPLLPLYPIIWLNHCHCFLLLLLLIQNSFHLTSCPILHSDIKITVVWVATPFRCLHSSFHSLDSYPTSQEAIGVVIDSRTSTRECLSNSLPTTTLLL